MADCSTKDLECKLIVVQDVLPLWHSYDFWHSLDLSHSNIPVIEKEDYSLFDEVYIIELDIEDCKEKFVKMMDSNITHAINDEEKEFSKRLKELGLYIINHPEFKLWSGYLKTDGAKRRFSHFTPREFLKLFISIITESELKKSVNEVSIEDIPEDINEDVKSMYSVILADYRNSQLTKE